MNEAVGGAPVEFKPHLLWPLPGVNNCCCVITRCRPLCRNIKSTSFIDLTLAFSSLIRVRQSSSGSVQSQVFVFQSFSYVNQYQHGSWWDIWVYEGQKCEFPTALLWQAIVQVIFSTGGIIFLWLHKERFVLRAFTQESPNHKTTVYMV